MNGITGERERDGEKESNGKKRLKGVVGNVAEGACRFSAPPQCFDAVDWARLFGDSKLRREQARLAQSLTLPVMCVSPVVTEQRKVCALP
jgi:hypothetical protein